MKYAHGQTKGFTTMRSRTLAAMALSLALIVAPVPALAAAKDDGADMAGAGLDNCVEFAQGFQRDPRLTEQVYTQWLLGFMTGINAATSAAGKPGKNITALSVYDIQRRMRAYCDAHPLGTYFEGAIQLMGELPRLKD
jgi:hypothetical protein